MTSLEIESPSLADTAMQSFRRNDRSVLVVVAAWLLRIEHRRVARKIPAGWDAALSFQLDRLTDIRERLAEYLDLERRRP